MRVLSFNDIIVVMTRQNFNPQDIGMVVGLGNPGKEYANTHHNIGRIYVMRVAKREANSLFTAHKKSGFEHTRFGNREWVLPLTFMNESGRAIISALKWFNTKSEALLIVHDDSDLPVGTVRLDFERGAAGHNGVLSIINALGTTRFWRARIGIRSENEKLPRKKAEVFVLKKISPMAQEKIEKAFCALDQFLDQGESK